MKVLIRQFLGQLHSWAATGWGEARALIALGHQVDLYATDGIKHLPPDLKQYIIGYNELNDNRIVGRFPINDYDMQISYTAMKNFEPYLIHARNRFGMWLWEWAGKNSLPTGFAKQYKHCSYLISPSTFGKEVFIQSGVPSDAIRIIPHGIDVDQYKKTTTLSLPTKKKFKIGVVLAQNHLRKNIPGMLEAYGKAFTNQDDVSLIIKGKNKPLMQSFDVSLTDCINQFRSKYPKHAEIKILPDFIPDMSDFYRSIDCTYTMSFCEGFYLPALESAAVGKLNICPGWGGQLDIANDANALLINGKEERADPRSLYWEQKTNAVWFRPSIDDAAEKLQHAYHNYENLNQAIEKQRERIYERYGWQTVAKQFLSLCK